VEQRLAVGWVKPPAASREHREHVVTVLLVMSGRR
jgi:hypothetical protein